MWPAAIGPRRTFARGWLHDGLLTIDREKMSKIPGQFLHREGGLAKIPRGGGALFSDQRPLPQPPGLLGRRLGGGGGGPTAPLCRPGPD